uniref:Cytochrome b n=1 Tax=Ismarus sp. ZJUH_2016020 TaxID=2491162 RepID=A0A3Q8UA59_9HYME|nr:cytochrome b [Ismarus sp. ZJUH_2016020]
MKKSIFKINELLKIINNSVIMLPTPLNISMWWNFGFLLSMCMIIQIITGIFLSMHYCANIFIAFKSIIFIMQEINYGWLIRLIHMNTASFFFIFIYIHISRGIYYNSFKLINTWIIGTFILLIMMMIAFLGYVLPWGQMSFWGATVITNLLSAIPFIGNLLVKWLWGGFSVHNPTLNRFFSIHFTLPFIMMMMIIIHLFFLHKTGSNNPLGTNSNLMKIPFYPYFLIKDLLGMIMMIIMLMSMCLINPYLFSDPENFIKANSMITPIHIQPEWYFLFAYAILRSIPNKLGGVCALILSILILLIMPFLMKTNMKNLKFYPINKMYFFLFININILLTWVGMKPIENPFISLSQILTIFYFLYFFMNSLMMNLWDKMLF